MKSVFLILRIICAVILVQTLYFKFTAHPDSVAIFTQLGLEPYGRIALGVIELLIAVLLILPFTALLGSVLASGILAGAIASHVFVLGTVVNNDGGLLFSLALIGFLCSSIQVFAYKEDILKILNPGYL